MVAKTDPQLMSWVLIAHNFCVKISIESNSVCLLVKYFMNRWTNLNNIINKYGHHSQINIFA